MKATSEIYREAAGENLECAEILHEHGKYAGAHYLAGVAVECILRAYLAKQAGEFDGRHDLAALFYSSGFEKRVPEKRIAEFRGMIWELARRWNNSQRYQSLPALRAALRKSGLHRGVRGDFAKASAQRAIHLARELVKTGEGRWTRPS